MDCTTYAYAVAPLAATAARPCIALGHGTQWRSEMAFATTSRFTNVITASKPPARRLGMRPT
jgi:hypothetical protein